METITYRPPFTDNVEQIENYRNGGFHPVHLGDSLADGRYRILHKLGYGGFSTVWLARDKAQNRLVSLKILAADESSACPELEILQALKAIPSNRPGRQHIMFLLDHFAIQGPNGSHICLVSQVAGPSIVDLSYSPGNVAGCRRLRGDIARLFAKQTAQAVGFLHAAGFIHGDLKASNVLVKLNSIEFWSDEQIYSRLGEPVKDDVLLASGKTPDLSAPRYLIEPACFRHPKLLSDEILLTDFGHAFNFKSPAPGLQKTTISPPYCAPEVLLNTKQPGVATEIWALACTLYEIRAGSQLFASFFGSYEEILRQVAQTLGKFTEPCWSAWKDHSRYFDEQGRPHREWPDGIALAVENPLLAQIRDIGSEDDSLGYADGDLTSELIMEKPGTRLSNKEVAELHDLLGKMLRYQPEDRILVDEVLRHQWLRRM